MKVREKEISLLGREIQFAYTEMKKLAYSLEAEVAALRAENIRLLVRCDEKFDIIDDKDKQLAEARAEIEKLKKHILAAINNNTKLSSAELKAAQRLRKESSPEALESERAANALLTEELERKDKLIEQMWDALKIVYNNHGYGRGNITDSELAVTAALSAAERGGQ